MKTLTLEDRFPFGKYKGKLIKNMMIACPYDYTEYLSYLNWWRDNVTSHPFDQEVKNAITKFSITVSSYFNQKTICFNSTIDDDEDSLGEHIQLIHF